MAGGGGVGSSGGCGTYGVGRGLLGGVEGPGTEGAMGGISTAAGGAVLGLFGVVGLQLLLDGGAACRHSVDQW
jgi:hypothetical protein